MDKNTLSQYGWVVIVIIVLIILIALTTPFGSFVAKSVKSSVEAFDGKVDNMFDDANINYNSPEFKGSAVMNSDTQSEITNYTVEEIAANDHLFAVGATKPEYIVAAFNDDFTVLTITANGPNSDGRMKLFSESFIDETGHDKTLQTCYIKNGVKNISQMLLCQDAILGEIATEYYNQHGSLTGLTRDIIHSEFLAKSNFTTVYIADTVESIDNFAFSKCEKLSNIYFGKGLKTIGEAAFECCWGLESIVIPDSVEVIKSGAFGLTALRSVVIGNGVSSLLEGAFYECHHLETITIKSDITGFDGDSVFSDCEAITTVKCVSGSTIDAWAQSNGYTVEYI